MIATSMWMILIDCYNFMPHVIDKNGLEVFEWHKKILRFKNQLYHFFVLKKNVN